MAGLALMGTTAVSPATPGKGQVILPSGRVLHVELAETPEQRARGYMFREKISGEEGMVFFMEGLGFHSFWMKNCKAGLDILWLDEKWQIVHIERELPPCADKPDVPCPLYTPMQASRYVLEVQAGLSAREGLKLGDPILYVPPLQK